MRQRSVTPFNISAAATIAAAIRSIEQGPSVLVDELLAEHSFVISFVNAHAVNLACNDAKFFRVLMSADLLLRDGLGAQILMRAIGRRPGINMNGTDFIPQILNASRSIPIALYGSSADVAATVATKLRNAGATQVTHCDGYQSLEHYVQKIEIDQPSVVVLGMGMPKQELIADAITKASAQAILVINGGAILDFMSGRIKRAPAPMRRFGLEWIFRLCLEPRRLWRRYLIGNVIFLARACFAVFYYRIIERHFFDSSCGIEGYVEMKKRARTGDPP
jgi:N-acetylglucosaminyldiphosphoundecaprenol N-acetyl-beta-D-mannosaminyltransferase